MAMTNARPSRTTIKEGRLLELFLAIIPYLVRDAGLSRRKERWPDSHSVLRGSVHILCRHDAGSFLIEKSGNVTPCPTSVSKYPCVDWALGYNVGIESRPGRAREFRLLQVARIDSACPTKH